MPYIFCVNEANRHICIDNRIFGVPKTDRARSQIASVKVGDRLFLYVYGTQRLYGIFQAKTEPFEELKPQDGPWNKNTIDRTHGYYPYRIKIEVLKYYKEGISLNDLDRLNIGIIQELFLRKSIIYISDLQANIIEGMLKQQKPDFVPGAEWNTTSYENLYSREVHVTDSEEKALQLLTQNNYQKLEEGLKAITSYFNLKFGGFKGEIDILGKDNDNNYVVTELKAGIVSKDIWSQVYSYSRIIREIYAAQEKVDVRVFIVCGGLNIKTLYSYPELKQLLRKEDLLRIYSYDTNFKDTINFKEIPIDYHKIK